MKIEKEQLIDLLSEQTGLDRSEVEENLNQLTGRIEEAANEGKSFTIESFGTFSLKEGELHFEADDTLQTEINQKYAGMKPIELIGAFQNKPEAEEGEEISAESVFGIEEAEQEEAVAPAEPEPEEESPFQEEGGEKGPSFVFDEDADDEEEDFADDATLEEEMALKEELERVEEEPALAVAGKEPVSKARKRKKEEESDSLGKMLTAAVVILAIGVAGWLVYDMGLMDGLFPGSGSQPVNTSSQVQARVPSAGQGTANTGQPSEGQTEEQAGQAEQNPANDVTTQAGSGEAPNTDVAEASRQSMYGLRGGAAPKATGGYTIVVHSLRDESTARSLISDFQTEGYRTVLQSAVVRGDTYWRVGLGQFRTVADANRAAAGLPEPLNSNYFVRRIN